MMLKFLASSPEHREVMKPTREALEAKEEGREIRSTRSFQVP